MPNVLLAGTAAMTLLVAGGLLPNDADATLATRAGDGQIELSSQNKPGRVVIKKRAIQKRVGAKVTRPSLKLNPQPEPPGQLRSPR